MRSTCPRRLLTIPIRRQRNAPNPGSDFGRVGDGNQFNSPNFRRSGAPRGATLAYVLAAARRDVLTRRALGVSKHCINASGHHAAIDLPSVTRLDSKFPE